MSLTSAQIEQFIADGFVRIDGAFPKALAGECRGIIRLATGCDADDPSTWKEPVVRYPGFVGSPFADAANTPRLTAAYDQLVGPGCWRALDRMGTFVLRFPVPGPVNDDGWHIDVSFAGPDADGADYFTWRANIVSRERALLMLFLFTDVGEADGPTRIRAGSHLTLPKRLAPAGEAGLTMREITAKGYDDSAHCCEALATGEAGTVYLCHPFIVHAAQRNAGTRPRFLAQPPLPPSKPFDLDRADGAYNAVERAIRLGLAGPS